MAKKKQGGICSPGGACYQFPPPACSICCMVFSLFGVIGLLSIGGAIKNQYHKAEGEEQWTSSQEATASSGAFIGTVIYVALIALCFGLFLWRKFTNKPSDDDIDSSNPSLISSPVYPTYLSLKDRKLSRQKKKQERSRNQPEQDRIVVSINHQTQVCVIKKYDNLDKITQFFGKKKKQSCQSTHSSFLPPSTSPQSTSSSSLSTSPLSSSSTTPPSTLESSTDNNNNNINNHNSSNHSNNSHLSTSMSKSSTTKGSTSLEVDDSGNSTKTVLRTLSTSSNDQSLSISMNQIHSTGGKSVLNAGGSISLSDSTNGIGKTSTSDTATSTTQVNSNGSSLNGANSHHHQQQQQQLSPSKPSSSNNNNNNSNDISKTLLLEIQFLERLLQDLIIQRNTNTRKQQPNGEKELTREGEGDGDVSEWKRYEEQLRSIIESKKSDFRSFITEYDKNKPVQKKSAFLKSGAAALVIFPTVMEEKLCSSLPLIYIDNYKSRSISNNSIQSSSPQQPERQQQWVPSSSTQTTTTTTEQPIENNTNNNNNQDNNNNNEQENNNINNNNSTAQSGELQSSSSSSSSLSSSSIITHPIKPFTTLFGPRTDVPEDSQSYSNSIYCKSGSSYPKHFTGRRQGDPICDRFKISIYREKVLVVLADGCNWGRLPYEAATNATNAFLTFLEDNHHFINTIRKAGSFLLAAMTAAHKGIIAGKSEVWEAGTTTLIGGMLTKIKKERDNNAILKRMSSLSFVEVDSDWVFIGVTLGDCKAFHYSKKNKIFTDITKGNRTNVSDARDPGGRLGPYVGNGEPDLRNLSVFYKYCDEGDLILLLSDGVHDNLDPQQLGIKPRDLGIEADNWDQAGQKYPVETDKVKNDYRTKWLGDRFKQDDLTPEFITNYLLKHCIETTQTSRDFMEQNTTKKLPCDYYLYPGKMDHNTCVCLKVGQNKYISPTPTTTTTTTTAETTN
ncbi:protein phosphatase 2C-related protein [Cavenderia fasciculata]|uniref:Protein phosphatase 2C-related protein n=1 Tax=Cavenderia fasciculata TaxID=261658 RepID=F4PSS1_CACFS|nr:protein phosphatase 2C-related protein [Cavenderia fasciculata]EGG21549.1 protein phosphatase 2C-related protein [Cavenderia fasciculata]|eukprot:XP_004359399.1 protein phosphatase 2C-related protein [Cavenderia fasciculata]